MDRAHDLMDLGPISLMVMGRPSRSWVSLGHGEKMTRLIL